MNIGGHSPIARSVATQADRGVDVTSRRVVAMRTNQRVQPGHQMSNRVIEMEDSTGTSLSATGVDRAPAKSNVGPIGAP
jgi:hypothetical protein